MNAVSDVLKQAFDERLGRAKLASEDANRYAEMSAECAALSKHLLEEATELEDALVSEREHIERVTY